LARQAGCPGFSAYARLEQATPGSSDYQAPFPFEGGIIKEVVVDVGNDRYLDICDHRHLGDAAIPGGLPFRSSDFPIGYQLREG
jgi:hypothetical protein